MRCVILLGALAALAAAFPRPQDQDNDPTPSAPAVSSPLQTWINPITSYVPPVPWPTPISESDDDSSSWFKSRSKRPHWEPIPIFTKECKCNLATARYPCWATDSLQRCNYEENFSYGCYMEAAGGCPTPTRVCSNLFQPTPRPGRHPCDLGPAPGLTTDISSLPTSVPAMPTSNVTIPVMPSGNATLPVGPTANVTVPVVPSANFTLPVVSLRK